MFSNKKIFVVVAAFLLATTAQAAKKPKADACSDKNQIYKTCSDQTQLFQKVMKESAAAKKTLVVVLGADWCPWCVVLHRIFDMEEFAKGFPELKFSEIGVYKERDRLASGDKVLSQLMMMAKVSEQPKGVPLLAVVNPISRKAQFIETEALEKNTEVSKGYDLEKLTQALKQASAQVH